MTIQDLKNNRERVIKAINYQTTMPNAVKEVMEKMVKWLEIREDIKLMKGTKSNIDKFTTMAINSWIKNLNVSFSDSFKSHEDLENWKEEREKKKYECISL